MILKSCYTLLRKWDMSMKADKIKAMLALAGKKNKEYYEYLGISRQAMFQKQKKDIFNVDDLIKLGELTNTHLAFVDDENKVILSFNSKDLRK